MTVQKFSTVYMEFLTDLQRAFPDKVVGDLDKGVKSGFSFFVRNQLPWMSYVASADEDWLVGHEGGRRMLIDGVSFVDVFSDERCNDATKEVIWTYLHSLYVVSLDIDREVVNKFLEGEDKDVVSSVEETFSLQADILANIKQYRAERKAEKEAAAEAAAEVKRAKKAAKAVKRNGDGGAGEGGADDEGNPFLNDKSKEFLENSTIGALAKELQSEIDVSDLPQVQNPEDMLGQLTGDGGGAMFNVMGKVMKKMDEKMKSGQLNHQTLMNEAGSLMGMMMGQGGGSGGAGGNPMAGLMSSLMGGGSGGAGGGSNPMMDLMGAMMGGGGDNDDNSRRKKKSRRSKRRAAALKARKMKKKADKAGNTVTDRSRVSEAPVDGGNGGDGLDKVLDGVLDGMTDDQTLTAGQLRQLLQEGGVASTPALEVPSEMRRNDEEGDGEGVASAASEEAVDGDDEAEEAANDDYGTEDSEGSEA